MNRGDLYRMATKADPKAYRAFVVISRQVLLDSKFSTVTCVPVYSMHNDLSTQVEVGESEGLKHESSIHCDEVISIPKALLTNYVGRVPVEKIHLLDRALRIAQDLEG
ncbi:MAG: type II toxin-antitoxin system PemK/MazF family toxin [Spirochaetota bacterium]